jgi:hypothetical protein
MKFKRIDYALLLSITLPLFLMGCDKKNAPDVETQTPLKEATPLVAPANHSNNDVGLNLPPPTIQESTKPFVTGNVIWDKILSNGLSVQVVAELNQYCTSLISEGREPEALALIDSLPLGLLRDGILGRFFSSCSLDFVKTTLGKSEAISTSDQKTLVNTIALRSPDENGNYPNFFELSTITSNKSLREDILMLAAGRVENVEQWEEINGVEMTMEGRKRAADSAFGKIAKFNPVYLEKYADDVVNPAEIREISKKWYSLYLLEKSPAEAATYIKAYGTPSTVKEFYYYWLKQDPAAATIWMKAQRGTKAYRGLVQETVNYAKINNELDSYEAWQRVLDSLQEEH